MPESYHPSILAELSAAQRAAIWQDKITHSLHSREWTTEQSDLIAELYSVITPDLFTMTAENPEDLPAMLAWLDDWGMRASLVIGFEDVRNIASNVYNLPPEPAPIVTVEADLRECYSALVDQLLSEPGNTTDPSAQNQPWCTCHAFGFASCRLGERCLPVDCVQSPTGCGWFQLMPCRARCGYVQAVEPVPVPAGGSGD